MRNIKNGAYIMLSVSLAAIALWDVALPLWKSMALSDAAWHVPGIYAVISAWGFPLLIAGMGCRYLTGSEPYEAGFILTKRLPRALVGCVVWWLVSALSLMKYNHPNDVDADTFFETMANVLETPHYVKFLLLTVVFFAFYPLLKRIADNQRLTGYAVLVFAAFSVLVPVLRYIPFGYYPHLFVTQVNWSFFTEFGLYLFLGVYLSRKTIPWHFRVVIYCAGVLSTVAMYACSVWTYTEKSGIDRTFIGEASPFTVLQTAAVLVLIVSLANKRRKPPRLGVWKSVAECSYLFVPLCAMLIPVYEKLLSPGATGAALLIPLEAWLILLPALLLSTVIRRLPVLSYFSI